MFTYVRENKVFTTHSYVTGCHKMTMKAEATGPNEVTLTFVVDAETAQDFAIGFDQLPHDEAVILDACEEAWEWQLAEAESKHLAELERRADRAHEEGRW